MIAGALLRKNISGKSKFRINMKMQKEKYTHICA